MPDRLICPPEKTKLLKSRRFRRRRSPGKRIRPQGRVLANALSERVALCSYLRATEFGEV